MTTLQYIGPHDEVVIASTGAVVARLMTVDIDDDDLALGLLDQPDNWVEVSGPSGPRLARVEALPPADNDDGDPIQPID